MSSTRSILTAEAPAPKRRRPGSQRRLASVHITLIVGAVFMVFPFVWELLTAFKTFGGSTQVPPQIIPDPWAWNFPDAFARINVGQMTINSVIITVACTLGQIVLCTMAGYGFARIPFRGRNALFMAFLAVLMVPGQLFLVPQFEIIGKLGLLDSLPGVILPGLFSAFGVFLMRQFFMSMPAELEEAARLDGANVWQIFRRVMLPLAKPGIIALAVFGALGNWNNLLWPLIILNTSNKFPLSVGISALSQDVHNSTNYPQLLSVALVAMLPMLITFIVLQRQFIAGIAFSGGKG
ncbi:MAG TPA: carbohydrate ABC transporter permease [Candidatus Lumbricidophila sp.]|nr:carbohydrate ABC transporter permease [Candidatus Lumbricidophila sp.]